MKLEFSRRIFEKYSNIKFRENLPVAAELFHVDRQNDRLTQEKKNMAKLIVAFRDFANGPKNAICGQSTEFLLRQSKQPAGVFTSAFYRLNIHRCSKKRPNFLNGAPTSTEGALRLLSAPSGRF
jgi:hypothetical protein